MQNLMVKLITVSTITLFLFSTTLKPITFPKFPDDFEKIIIPSGVRQLSVGNTEVGLISDRCFFLDNKIRGGLSPLPKDMGEIRDPLEIPSYRIITQVAVGYDDSVWGINDYIKEGINVFQRKKDWISIDVWRKKKGNLTKKEHENLIDWWIEKKGNLVQISVGKAKPKFIWGVNAIGQLFYWIGGIKGWKQHNRPNNIPLKHVSCGYDGALWVIGKDDDSVWRWNKKWEQITDFGKRSLKEALGFPIPLKLEQVDVGDKDHVVGIAAKNVAKIYDPSSKKSEIIGEGIKNISINKDGDIWLVTTKGDVYRGTFRVK